MPKLVYEWCWEEAFDPSGFDDGDGIIMTGKVTSALEDMGFDCDVADVSAHNRVIVAFGTPAGERINCRGYVGSPRKWLPREVVVALDERFPEGSEERRRPVAYRD